MSFEKSDGYAATLQIEGMLQTMVILIYQTVNHDKERSFITDIDVKVLNAAKPGIDIEYEAKILRSGQGIFKGQVIGKSNSLTICKGHFLCVTTFNDNSQN